MRLLGGGLLVALAVMKLASVAAAQTAKPAPPVIEEMMTAREFEAAGLRKLSSDELRMLNVWLRTYTQTLSQTIVQGTTASNASATPDLIESQIDGEFEGWEGETIFKLRNGQVWQQTSYAYTYHYAYGPKVLIYRSGGVYKMKVDGVAREITVRRLK